VFRVAQGPPEDNQAQGSEHKDANEEEPTAAFLDYLAATLLARAHTLGLTKPQLRPNSEFSRKNLMRHHAPPSNAKALLPRRPESH
jgi:hypothetical protein